MPEMLTFSEAARRAGVSRQRLNRAIHLGNLPAERGGGPGKPTRIWLEDLQAWCAAERLPMPVEPSERAERAPALVPPTEVAALMERLERTMEQAIARAVDRVVDQVVERLAAHLEHAARPEHVEREERPERQEHARRSIKAEVLQRLRAMQAEGLGPQAMADQLNAESIPTLSGTGRWSRGTIANLLRGK